MLFSCVFINTAHLFWSNYLFFILWNIWFFEEKGKSKEVFKDVHPILIWSHLGNPGFATKVCENHCQDWLYPLPPIMAHLWIWQKCVNTTCENLETKVRKSTYFGMKIHFWEIANLRLNDSFRGKDINWFEHKRGSVCGWDWERQAGGRRVVWMWDWLGWDGGWEVGAGDDMGDAFCSGIPWQVWEDYSTFWSVASNGEMHARNHH